MTNIKQQHVFIWISLFFSIAGLSFFYNHYKKKFINTIQTDLVLNKRISLQTKLSSHCLAPSQSISMLLRHLKIKRSHDPSFQQKYAKVETLVAKESLNDFNQNDFADQYHSFIQTSLKSKRDENLLIMQMLLMKTFQLNNHTYRDNQALSNAYRDGNFRRVLSSITDYVQSNFCIDDLNSSCSNFLVTLVTTIIIKEDRLNFQNDNKETILHYSSQNSHQGYGFNGFNAYYYKNFQLISLLLENGAQCNIQDNNGKTPLHYACSLENLELVELLLKNGVQCNIQDKEGKTPLHYACSLGNLALIEILLNHGVRYDIKDNAKKTSLHYLYYLYYSYSDDRTIQITEILKKMITKPVSISPNDDKNNTLLRKKRTLNARDDKGNTLLHYACRDNDIELILLLLENGAQYNIQNNKKETPLSDACFQGNLALVEILLYNGPRSDNQKKEKAAYLRSTYNLYIYIPSRLLEIKKKYFCILKRLIQHEAELDLKNNLGKTILHDACRNKDIELISFLLENGAQCNIQDDNGKTPLHEACSDENLALVELLLNHDARCNIKDKEGKTPLHDACSDGNLTLVDILLNHSARCDIQDHRKETPLYLFYSFFKNIDHAKNDLKEKAYKLIKFMIETKLGLNSQDHQGNTLLHYVCSHNHSKIATLLVENGAQFNIQNTNNKTPLDITHQKGFLSLEEYLLTKQSA